MKPDERKIGPWRRIRSERGPSYRIFDVRVDHLENPRNQEVLPRVVLENPDWVNVIARTDDGAIVIVRQYRFGTEAVTSEIPGGMVDPGEDSRRAAERELMEETGYAAREWRYLGCVEPNPAFLNNLCHHWLAEGAYQAAEPALEIGEDIEVVELREEEIRAGVERGEFRHVLVLSALGRLFDMRSTPLTTQPPWRSEE